MCASSICYVAPFKLFVLSGPASGDPKPAMIMPHPRPSGDGQHGVQNQGAVQMASGQPNPYESGEPFRISKFLL